MLVNPTETPPLGVDVTYTTLRLVTTGGREIPVQKRDPAPVTERFIAVVSEGDWQAEFRCHLNATYDATFDHMVGSFSITTP